MTGPGQLNELRFGPFEISPANRALYKDGQMVKLQSQHFELLALLVQRPGEIVSRDEIRQALWGADTFVDFDRSINFGINKIREALSDDPRKPRYIETIPRRGYRFLAPIATDLSAPPNVVLPAKSGFPMKWLVALCLVIPLAAVGFWSRRAGSAGRITSIAVLPFENLSASPEQDYFASGLTDELTTALAKIGALRVVPRASVLAYKGTRKQLSQIARELKVDALIQGAVTRDGDRVRITAQLIGESPERHLWAEKYEGILQNVLAMQNSVAEAVVHEIRIKVTATEQAGLSAHKAVDPAAYELYLRGLYLKPVEANIKKSIEYFEQAIAKDPGYAPAWAELAESDYLLGAYGILPRVEAVARAKKAAETATQIDPYLPGPLIMLANVKMTGDWDWIEAEREYKHVIELWPNGALAHMQYSHELALLGRTREAVEESLRARELSPAVYWPNMQVAWHYYFARDYERTELESAKLIEWEPEISWGYICRGSAYLQTGRGEEAVADFRKALGVSNRGTYELMYLGHALGVTGLRPEAQGLLHEMLGLLPTRHIPPEFIAVVYEGLGDRERAIEWFRKSYAEKSMHGWVVPDPRLDGIRTDERFQVILRQMGLPQ